MTTGRDADLDAQLSVDNRNHNTVARSTSWSRGEPHRHHAPKVPHVSGNVSIVIASHAGDRSRSVSDVSASSTTTTTTTTTTSTIAPAAHHDNVSLRLSSNFAAVRNCPAAGSPTVDGNVVTYDNPCVTASSAWPVFTNDPASTNYVLQAVSHARSIHGIAPMTLPTN